MNHPRRQIVSATLAMIALGVWIAPATAGGGAKKAEPAAEGGGHGAPAEGHGAAPEAGAGDAAGTPAAPLIGTGAGSDNRRIDDFKLGEGLENHFDITVLKNRERVTAYRIELTDIKQLIRSNDPRRPQYLIFSCVVEFGNESGPKELREERFTVEESIRSQVQLMKFSYLMKDAGKQAVKRMIAEVVNQQLLTARVRSVYLTEYVILAEAG